MRSNEANCFSPKIDPHSGYRAVAWHKSDPVDASGQLELKAVLGKK